MKIAIPVKKGPKTGKGFFCQRLAEALGKMGHKVVSENSPHEVSLHIVKLNKGRGKRVTRLDGVYHNTAMDYKSRNKNIAKNLHAADAVVYQSKFSRKICNKYLGKFRGPQTVIANGADPGYYKAVSPVKTGYKHAFLSASRWRPHKRLRDIMESFLLADIPDSVLYIAGNLKQSGMAKADRKNYFRNKNIIDLGSLSQKDLAGYLKASSAFVHLCWFDNCPNAVVEAMCAGVPVISNNVGGTPEIVAPSGGIVCDIDTPYNFKPVKLYKPPKVDRNKIAEAMHQSLSIKKINNRHVDILSVAQQYVKFFGSLL